MDVFELIKLLDDGNIDKKFQPCILNRSRENPVCPTLSIMDGQTDIWNKSRFNTKLNKASWR